MAGSCEKDALQGWMCATYLGLNLDLLNWALCSYSWEHSGLDIYNISPNVGYHFPGTHCCYWYQSNLKHILGISAKKYISFWRYAMIGYGSQFILHVLWPCWLYIYILSFCIFRLEKSHIMPDFRSRQSEATTLIEIGIYTVYTNPNIIYRGWPQQFILRLFLIREFVEICEFVKSLIREEDRL